MEEFIEYAKVIMGTLGHKLFDPVSKPLTQAPVAQSEDLKETGTPLHMERAIKGVGKVEADGVQTTEGFVVLQGSHISLVDDETIPATIKERRKCAPVDGNGILKEDIENNKWMYEWYLFLKRNSDLENAYNNFDEMKAILRQNFSWL